MRLYYLTILGLLLFSKLNSCTDFNLVDQDNNYVVGRSLEFGIELNSEIRISPRGLKYQSYLKNDQKAKSWDAKYAFVSLTLGTTDLAVDGLNEKGLSVGVLWFPGAKYPKITESNPNNILNLEDATNWILSSFETVEDVKVALKNVQIWFHPMKELSNITPPIHLSLHDRLGKSLVVEFVNGEMQISNNPVGVLTNAPYFEWHLINLDNYINLSAMNKGQVTFDQSVLEPTGQGSGLLGIPGDWTPPSRFIRIAVYKGFVSKVKSPEENVNLAFHLLNDVDIPYGAIQTINGKNYEYTQWIVVKDQTNQVLYYRTYLDLDIKKIDLREEDIKAGASVKRYKIKGAYPPKI